MRKRSWFSCVYVLAFAVSLAHNSIPHAHPEKTYSHAVLTGHRHDHHSHEHDAKGDHHESSLPVFSHFSNADYIGNPKYEFTAKSHSLIQALNPVGVSFNLPDDSEEQVLFPRPREHPPNRVGSSQSLRAPPFHS